MCVHGQHLCVYVYIYVYICSLCMYVYILEGGMIYIYIYSLIRESPLYSHMQVHLGITHTGCQRFHE